VWIYTQSNNTLHILQMSSNKELRSLTLDSAHEKFDV
jgi:hypothetical protein